MPMDEENLGLDAEETVENTGSVPEGEETQDELDERGVPWKNRVKELERKLDQSTQHSQQLEQMYQLLAKQHQTKEDRAESTFRELTIDEIAQQADAEPETISALLKMVENRIDRRLHLAEEEDKKNKQWQSENLSRRMASIKEFSDSYCGDDPVVTMDPTNPGRVVWNQNSKILRKAREVLAASPFLSKIEGGEMMALMQAKMELSRTDPSDVDKAQGLLGKGGARPQGGSIKRGGKFYRPLSDDEYSKLTTEEKNAYDMWEVGDRLKSLAR